MPNTLEYASVLQKALDQQVLAGAASAWMEDNAGQVKYSGGNEVKIPTLSTDGLADYDRDKGFTGGAVSLAFNTYKMTMDRGRSFSLDAMDVNETNFIANATAVIGEFQKRHVIPEIDAYRYAKIYSIVKDGLTGNVATYTPTETTILKKLKMDISDVQDVVGDGEEIIVCINRKIASLLELSKDITKYLNVVQFEKGGIKTTIKYFDDAELSRVPSARLKTAYKFSDGKSAGQEKGGFSVDATAKDINWIVIPKKTPIAVSKTDKVRIFKPDTNQNADAYKVDYRKYHDIWIPKNRICTIKVSVGA